MNTIDKIRAEIERLVKLNKECAKAGGDRVFLEGITAGYADVLSFLDTIEEPVSDCHDLEEELENYYGSIPDDEDKINAARHFAEWQKAKMMEGAVEGYVTYGSKGAYVESDWLGTYDVEVFGPNGSTVKIIVVKEEEQ